MRISERVFPIVYVCHPYTGDPVGNGARIVRICRDLSSQGALPLAPQIYLPAFLDEGKERDRALLMCLTLLGICDEVRVHGGPTAGMRLEIAAARGWGIPVRPGGGMG